MAQGQEEIESKSSFPLPLVFRVKFKLNSFLDGTKLIRQCLGIAQEGNGRKAKDKCVVEGKDFIIHLINLLVLMLVFPRITRLVFENERGARNVFGLADHSKRGLLGNGE